MCIPYNREGGGRMEVYVEVTYLMNAFLILLSFEILCYLLNIQMTKKELLKYVFLFNCSLFLLYIDMFCGFILIYDFIIFFFYFKKMIYIYYPLYLFIYISLLSFLNWILPSSLIFQGILIIERIQGLSMLILGIIIIICFYFYISFCQMKIKNREMVDVCFLNQKCLGFVDSGNKVFYKGYPVIFISRMLLNQYDAIDHISIDTAMHQDLVDIMILDEIEINHCLLHHVYVGVMNSSEYDCILNRYLLGGLL